MDAQAKDWGEILVEAHCPAHTRVLPHIRRLICSVAEAMGFSEDEVNEIEISVDEACANAIHHGYPKGTGREARGLRVRLIEKPDCLTILVSDEGVGVAGGNPGGVASLEEYSRRDPPHGLGSFIMRRFMDTVEYARPSDKGAEVRLVKTMRRRPESTGTPP